MMTTIVRDGITLSFELNRDQIINKRVQMIATYINRNGQKVTKTLLPAVDKDKKVLPIHGQFAHIKHIIKTEPLR